MGNVLNKNEINKFITDSGYKIIKGFKKSSEKLKLICPEGHEIHMLWHNFKKGHRCKKCGRKMVAEKFKLTYEYVSECLQKEGYKILDDIYVNAKKKIKVECSEGHVHYTTFDKFNNKRSRCPKCQKMYRYSYDEVYDIIKSMGLELLSKTYKDAHEKLKIKCRCGNIFYKNFNKIKYEPQCPSCGIEERARKSSLGIEYVKKYMENYGYKLLSTEYKNDTTELLIKCPKGHEYSSTFDRFRSGCRCVVCNNSKGEKKIEEYLHSKNINFKRQFKFNNCRNKNPLPFDFAIFDEYDKLIFLIEYNGEQHYEPIDFFGGERQFKIQVKRDNIKKTYCKDNNINLIIIPYWKFDNIEELLDEYIAKYI